MDRDYFIITVYCLVCTYYQQIIAQHRLQQRGYAPAFSDEEAITLVVCGEYFGYAQDEDIYDYFNSHYRHFFPKLPSRTTFVRQVANLWHIQALIQQRLVSTSQQDVDPVQPIDTLPLPVCGYTRSRRDRCFSLEADYGHCAAKDLDYYGFKLGLRISRLGMIVHYPLLPARPHDSQLLDDLLSGFEGVAPADKGFIGAFRQQELARKRLVELVTPARKNMKVQPSATVKRICSRWRKLVETVGSQLVQRYHIAQTRAHDLWHYQARLIRKVLSHTVCVFLNLQLGRPPLDLDDLVSV